MSKYFQGLFIGFFIGATIVSVAWAAQSVVMVDGSGNALGTTSNPIIFTVV